MINKEIAYKIYKQSKRKNKEPVYLIDYEKLENQIIEAASNGLNYTVYYGLASDDDIAKLHNELHYSTNIPMHRLPGIGLVQISGMIVYWENFK